MRRFLLTLGVCLLFGTLFFLPHDLVFAEITEYRSAQTVLTAGNPPYSNLENCSETDGLTCDRVPPSTSYGRLYFQDFGDFGIPEGSTITYFRMRVTGKATVGVYAGAFDRKDISGNSCLGSAPSYIWQMWDLYGTVMNEWNRREQIRTGTLDSFDYCFTEEKIRTNNFTFMVWYSGPQFWTANIDNFEVAFEYEPPPPPPAPEPFLSLPWDYEGKGLSFSTAATAINSYFDHEYPLLSRRSIVINSPEAVNTLVSYMGGNRSTALEYPLHDGYDWGKRAGAMVNYKDPVLASADGIATIEKSSTGCGYMILINHRNNFQTRYCHLNPHGYLVIQNEGESIEVEKGQQIGEVGFSGNVLPSGEDGSHIHFMVVYDKNNDGNFEDNIPDGLVDPFGWWSEDSDPWESYTFDYLGISRTGMKSHYLWTTPLGSVNTTVPKEGEQFEIDTYTIIFFESAYLNQNFDMNAFIVPIVSPSNLLGVLGPGISITAESLFGNAITSFTNPFILSINFSEIDLTRYDPGTISFYSSTDGENWIREAGTVVDLENRQATVELEHLTEFALMAERIDTTPPLTTPIINGDSNTQDFYNSDVVLSLLADDGDGLGVEYTMYSTDGIEWMEYLEPILFMEEGKHNLNFLSVDNDENIEDVKTVEFHIDKTLPDVEIDARPKILWPPNGQLVNVMITGTSSDENLASTEISVIDEYGEVNLTGLEFGQTIQLPARRDGTDKDGRVYTIKATVIDMAGNVSISTTDVLVPHNVDDM